MNYIVFFFILCLFYRYFILLYSICPIPLPVDYSYLSVSVESNLKYYLPYNSKVKIRTTVDLYMNRTNGTTKVPSKAQSL